MQCGQVNGIVWSQVDGTFVSKVSSGCGALVDVLDNASWSEMKVGMPVVCLLDGMHLKSISADSLISSDRREDGSQCVSRNISSVVRHS